MSHNIRIIPARHSSLTPALLDVLIRITPQAATEAPPVDLALVVDTSGSMNGTALNQARDAIHALIPQFRPDDRVALVTYATGPTMQLPLLPLGDGLPLRQRLTHLRASGNTALHAGWQLGTGLLIGARHPARLSSVLLLTDGKPNVGETRPTALAADLRHALLQGISTSVVGSGLRYNETLLERLADAGDGHFHHAEQPHELGHLLSTELAHLHSTVGRQARLRVEGIEVIDVLNDLPREGYDLLLPPLRAGGEMRLLLRVRAHAGQTAQLSLTWTDLQGHAQRQDLTFTVLLAVGVTGPEHPEVVQRRAELLAARAQRELAGHLDGGDVARALDTLTLSRRHLLRAQAGGADVGSDLEELGELERQVRRGERQAASKKARSQAYSKSTGRD
ncbi:VWA domain-containing protein [Deinococcus sp.]|uniref:VWA domain-containing protein n=1 Tax=Deinococcus sp. TaxID=47478 RepID=UPI0025B95C93|nr:VWA domain-containing protein [Deinococcus sp.]